MHGGELKRSSPSCQSQAGCCPLRMRLSKARNFQTTHSEIIPAINVVLPAHSIVCYTNCVANGCCMSCMHMETWNFSQVAAWYNFLIIFGVRHRSYRLSQTV
jgi:hypothetical protein